jgi:hypothetical protein
MKNPKANWLTGWERRGAWLAAIAIQAVCGVFLFRAAPLLALDQSLEDRFLKEAPAKWLEYRQIVARHTEGNAKRFFETSRGEKDSLDVSFAIKIDGSASIAKVVSFENRHAEKVEAFNAQYRFRLVAGRGGQWTIDRLRNGGHPVPADLIGRNPRFPMLMGEDGTCAAAFRMPFLGQVFNSAWLPRLVQAPEFRLIRVSELKGESGLLRVDFRFDPKTPTGGGALVRSGTVVLDAKRYWLIREADTEAAFLEPSDPLGLTHPRGKLTIRNKIADAKTPVPYVSHQTLVASGEKDSEGRPWKFSFVTDVELRDVPNIDPRQFMLSAYGLPEPPAK